MTKNEALKKALAALEGVHQDPKGWWNCHVEITAIKDALAQPEQEENTKQRVLQLIKELRPAIRPMEALGKPMTTHEWFDVLVKNIKENT